jgi:hypothetical protein
VIGGEDDEGVFVGGVELPHHFAAAAARWEDGAVLVDRDDIEISDS